MNPVFRDYLFQKRILVSETGMPAKHGFEALYALGAVYGIRVVEGADLINAQMLVDARRVLGDKAPEPFYRGFPDSVRSLTPDQLRFDRLLHYARTYGLGDFSHPGHSVMELLAAQAQGGEESMEQIFARTAFRESGEVRDFRILAEDAARAALAGYMEGQLASTRPIPDDAFLAVQAWLLEQASLPERIPCKPTVFRLLIGTQDLRFARYLRLPDVERFVEHLQYYAYAGADPRRLNLKNRHRKLITAMLDAMLQGEITPADVQSCCARRARWCGLLHHLHYRPSGEVARHFVQAMRGGRNLSVESACEMCLRSGQPVAAARLLREQRGAAAVLRHLDALLARCADEGQAGEVLALADTENPIVLLQVLRHLARPVPKGSRTFRFVRFGRLAIHEECSDGVEGSAARQPDPALRARAAAALGENLKRLYRNRLGRVWADEAMKRVALPIQEGASMGGFGALPRGSRVPLEGLADGSRKLRAFVYWEQVDDIDLSAVLIDGDGEMVEEFSWRTMDALQDVLLFSGDETSGWEGGSEYFDVDLASLRDRYPQGRYLVFSANVYSGTPFSKCVCRAGSMLREALDSGEVFEPKTVTSALKVNGSSTFCHLFAVDLDTAEQVWLNLTRQSEETVAGEARFSSLLPDLEAVRFINVYELLRMQASALTDTPEEAGIWVTDAVSVAPEGVDLVHSWDFERLLQWMQ